MAGAAVDNASIALRGSGAPSSSPGPRPSYLKSYPYLFVRETDQTDYFCTVCEECLTEDQLQSHLFETHGAENLPDYFVRISYKNNNGENQFLYICVVCWAKLDSSAEMVNHRESCKVNFGDDSNDGEAMDTVDGMVEQVTSVVSTPDIPAMMDDTEEHPSERMNGSSAKTNGSIVIPGSPSFPQPEVILETDVGQPQQSQAEHTSHEETYSSQCLQCSLCTMVLPSSSYLSHLRTYHRVTCPLTSANCPLCMTSVPIMDLTVHLATQHGLVPQTAVNALLLWVLTSNTFALNDSAQASLKSKFKGQQQQQQLQPPQHSLHNKSGVQQNTSTPKLKSSLQQSYQSHNNNNKKNNNLKTALTSPISQTLPGVFHKPEGPLINDLRGKISVEQIIGQLTRSHTGPGGKESHQCLVCSKWYAIPPVKHMRSHIATFNKERKRVAGLASGASICLICYKVCDSQHAAAAHISTHTTEGLPGGASGGLLAEALMGFPSFSSSKAPSKIEPVDVNDDLPLGATFETPGLKLKPAAHSPATSLASNNTTGTEMMNVELDNAGRVKSGKVRKQCELCGEWSNIKWFFKHMSEVHQALFCRCCREYLPIHEHKEHRQWHQMPPYMGQKIRIEDGQPIIIDRKERASLTPIGSLAAWGGSSGGLVVKAVDEVVNRKRKADKMISSPSSVKTCSSGSVSTGGGFKPGTLPPDPAAASEASEDDAGRDSLMPRERCPVCAIEITHKNLARHIKLRHGIRYKFCYKCRKLVPGHLYAEHKALHESGQLETIPGAGDAQLEMMDNLDSCRSDEEDGDAIEIPEEMLDQALDSSGSKKKDETFRANTSMTKLESLMGKEFKHPRRKCQICGYSVSYSNFKRHMRNAHPNELGEDPSMGDMGEMGGVEGVEMGMMGHHMDDSDRMSYNASAGGGEETDNVELVDGYVECKRCGDHVMKEFLGSHMRMEHGESEAANVKESSPRDIIMRACPECGIEMRSDSIIKHCKMKHKASYRYCSASSKYILKKSSNSHSREHENGELAGKIDIEDGEDKELDTSKDDDDQELIIDDEPVTEEAGEIDPEHSKSRINKIYNCFDCNRMFMSAEAHANHLRDVHGGEGGSVLLKLPRDKVNGNDIEPESDDEVDKPDNDELVIDEM